MARGKSGLGEGPERTGFGAGPVTLPEPRAKNLRELLLALSSPGCCIVVGAGASRGVVPMRPEEIGKLAIKFLRSEGNQALSSTEREQALTSEVQFLVIALRQVPKGAWDRVLVDMMTPGQASYLMHSIFNPADSKVPPALYEVYRCFEARDGVIVSYNYDPIATKQKRFPVIFPHGTLSPLFTDRRVAETTIRMAREFHQPIPNDWYMPVPEVDAIRGRQGYADAVEAWSRAKSIVFVGYGFGSGADEISFQDFGRVVSPLAPVHVLCPPPDNADLVRQVGHTLRGRGKSLLYGQPFRWNHLAESIIWLLEYMDKTSVRDLVGWEALVARAHDEGGRPEWAQRFPCRSRVHAPPMRHERIDSYPAAVSTTASGHLDLSIDRDWVPAELPPEDAPEEAVDLWERRLQWDVVDGNSIPEVPGPAERYWDDDWPAAVWSGSLRRLTFGAAASGSPTRADRSLRRRPARR
jgi:hypothetical protein